MSVFHCLAALAPRIATPQLLARFRDFERAGHAPRSPPGTKFCAVVYRRAPCVLRSREREERPTGAGEKHANVGGGKRQHVYPCYNYILRSNKLMNVVVVVVSLWAFTSESVLECHVLERLSRAPRDRQRPRDRATPAQHSNPQCRRRKNGHQRQTRQAGRVGRSRPGPRYGGGP